jgi:hypothetical protein
MAAYPPPSDDVLEHMADDHVFYELHRTLEFAHHGNVLPIGGNVPPEVRADLADWSQSAILESSLIHLRNVSDFLTKTRPTQKHAETDLVADHYFVNGWHGRPDFIFGTDKSAHDAVLKEIHRRVAHLTVQRHTVPWSGAIEWQPYVTQQFPVLLRAFAAFLADLIKQEPGRAAWFNSSTDLLVGYRYLQKDTSNGSKNAST